MASRSTLVEVGSPACGPTLRCTGRPLSLRSEGSIGCAVQVPLGSAPVRLRGQPLYLWQRVLTCAFLSKCCCLSVLPPVLAS